jgi:RNA polymerase sigma-70 factor (ECF subfamily)
MSTRVGEVYSEHAEALRSLARRQLGDPVEADDVVAATFSLLMTLKGPHTQDPRGGAARAFAFGVCANLIRRFRRARARRGEVLARYRGEPPATGEDLERTVAQRQLAARLAEALAELPEEQRTALLLSALEDYSAADIAAIYGVPEATVRTRLFHARRKLRASIDGTSRRGRLALGVALVLLLVVAVGGGPRAWAARLVAVYHRVVEAITQPRVPAGASSSLRQRHGDRTATARAEAAPALARAITAAPAPTEAAPAVAPAIVGARAPAAAIASAPARAPAIVAAPAPAAASAAAPPLAPALTVTAPTAALTATATATKASADTAPSRAIAATTPAARVRHHVRAPVPALAAPASDAELAPSSAAHAAATPDERAPTAANDPSHALYVRAHHAQFVARDYADALAAWDEYLARPAGTFAVEAQFNRAIALAQLGRVDEARAAIAPFAAGAHGDYRRQSARRLLDLLAKKALNATPPPRE